MSNLFFWIGHLFVSQAQDAAQTVVKDEINKVHDEIAASIAPYLAQIPKENQQAALQGITDVAKKAAVAYAEAYINSKIPAIPANPAIPTSSTPPAPPAA